MANFSPIRDVPATGLSEWESTMLNAMKENIEIMTGTRQSGVRVITSDNIKVASLNPQVAAAVTGTGQFATLSGVDVPTYAEYLTLRNDVQLLMNDLYYTREAINSLLTQLR